MVTVVTVHGLTQLSEQHLMASEPEDVAVDEGNAVKLHCALGDDRYPCQTINWMKITAYGPSTVSSCRTAVNNDPRFSISYDVFNNSFVLQIQNVGIRDAGSYYCRAKDVRRRFQSRAATLTVREQPLPIPLCGVSPMIRDRFVRVGSSVHFTCTLPPNSAPMELTWINTNDTSLYTESVSAGGSHSLQWDVKLTDNSAIFSCYASRDNIDKGPLCSIPPLQVLPVLYKLDVLRKPKGRSADFNCTMAQTHATSLVNVQWVLVQKEGIEQMINGTNGRYRFRQNGSSFRIKNVSYHDNGTRVWCEVTNNEGKTYRSTESTILYVFPRYSRGELTTSVSPPPSAEPPFTTTQIGLTSHIVKSTRTPDVPSDDMGTVGITSSLDIVKTPARTTHKMANEFVIDKTNDMAVQTRNTLLSTAPVWRATETITPISNQSTSSNHGNQGYWRNVQNTQASKTTASESTLTVTRPSTVHQNHSGNVISREGSVKHTNYFSALAAQITDIPILIWAIIVILIVLLLVVIILTIVILRDRSRQHVNTQNSKPESRSEIIKLDIDLKATPIDRNGRIQAGLPVAVRAAIDGLNAEAVYPLSHYENVDVATTQDGKRLSILPPDPPESTPIDPVTFTNMLKNNNAPCADIVECHKAPGTPLNKPPNKPSKKPPNKPSRKPLVNYINTEPVVYALPMQKGGGHIEVISVNGNTH